MTKLKRKLLALPVSAFLASISFMAGQARSECCYAVTSAPLSPDSYSLFLTTSSQQAVDSTGMIYQTDISFPSDYIIDTVPTACTQKSETDYECNSSGNPLFTVDFPSITTSTSGSQVPPVVSYVGVGGETCTQQPSCPRLSPSNSGGSTGPSSSTTPSRPPGPTRTSTSSNNSFSQVDNKKATIIGVSVAVVVVILIAMCIVLRRNTTSVSSTGLTRKSSMHARMARRSGDGVPAGGPGSFGGPDGYALYRQRALNRARSVRDLQEKAAAAAAAAAKRSGSKEGISTSSGIGSGTAELTMSFGSASELSEYSHGGSPYNGEHGGGMDSRAEMGLARHPSTRTYSSLRTARSMGSSDHIVNVFEDKRYTTDDGSSRVVHDEKEDIQLEPTSPTEPSSRHPVITSPLSKKTPSRQPINSSSSSSDISSVPSTDRPVKDRPSEAAMSKSVGFVDMDRDEMLADRTYYGSHVSNGSASSQALHRSVSLTRSRAPPVPMVGMGSLSNSASYVGALPTAVNQATVVATHGLQRSLSTKERRELDEHRAHASRHIMRPDSDD